MLSNVLLGEFGDLSLPRNGEWTNNGARTAVIMSGIDSICFNLNGHFDNGAVASKSRHNVDDQHIRRYTGVDANGVSVSLVVMLRDVVLQKKRGLSEKITSDAFLQNDQLNYT